MFRNIITYIFIYTFIITLTGCEIVEQMAEDVMSSSHQDVTNWTTENYQCWDDDIDLQVSIPNLIKDDNGYYHMDFLEGYTQTFVNIEADVGIDYRPVYVEWMSSLLYNYQGTPISPVNTSSYSDSEGIATTVLGVWEPFIGDTLVVTGGCINECGEQSTDFIKIIVE